MAGEALIQRQHAAVFIGQPDIAAMLGIDRRTLRRLIVAGKFPAADLVLSQTCLRWRQSTVDAWIAANVKGEGADR